MRTETITKYDRPKCRAEENVILQILSYFRQ